MTTPPNLARSMLPGFILALALSGFNPSQAITNEQAPSIVEQFETNRSADPSLDPFRISGKPPEFGFLSSSSLPIDHELLNSEMLKELAGIFGSFERRSFSSLKRSTKPIDPNSNQEDQSDPIAYLHLQRDEHKFIYELFEQDPKSILMRAIDDPSRAWTINKNVFDKAIHTGGFELSDRTETQTAQPDPIGKVFEMPKPYIESKTTLDLKTIRSRIKHQYPRLTRTSNNELYRVRLPKGFDPDQPSGVLVWISPTPDGRIPNIFNQALDELGLIAIGIDNNGNKRDITDRLQNHLDSIETIANTYRIDRSRIYLTGMSGGGRCSGILLCAFPDLFAGAVPIVGLDTYHQAPTGERGKHWPARLGKPAARWMKLLKERRIASITGSMDFNQPEMSTRNALLTRDGIESKLDIIDGMGHSMPTSSQFANSLIWVNEPRAIESEQSLDQANELLESLNIDSSVSIKQLTRAQINQLVKITQLSPWSDPAWRAANLLGYPKPE